MHLDHCLATYGTLAPGRPNHHQLSALRGEWCVGTVRGHLVANGWGAALGYPALVLAEDGAEVEVHLLRSPDLPDHWARLDALEGAEYRRTQVEIQTPDGQVSAWMYLDAAAA